MNIIILLNLYLLLEMFMNVLRLGYNSKLLNTNCYIYSFVYLFVQI